MQKTQRHLIFSSKSNSVVKLKSCKTSGDQVLIAVTAFLTATCHLRTLTRTELVMENEEKDLSSTQKLCFTN